MQVFSYAETLDSIMKPSNYGEDDRLFELSRMCVALESSLRQIVRIQDHLASIQKSDYAQAFIKLRQILEEAQTQRKIIHDLLDSQFRIKSVDAAELTVGTSRSAVACKI